jgi:hypothetical protein
MGGGGYGGEMAQTMYAYMNKWIKQDKPIETVMDHKTETN